MYKGLINTLSYMHRFATLGRGKLEIRDLEAIKGTADVLVRTAPAVLENEETESPEAAATDMLQAQLLNTQIEEMVDWIIRLEIV